MEPLEPFIPAQAIPVIFPLHLTYLQNAQNRRQAAFLIRLAKVKIFDRPARCSPSQNSQSVLRVKILIAPWMRTNNPVVTIDLGGDCDQRISHRSERTFGDAEGLWNSIASGGDG